MTTTISQQTIDSSPLTKHAITEDIMFANPWAKIGTWFYCSLDNTFYKLTDRDEYEITLEEATTTYPGEQEYTQQDRLTNRANNLSDLAGEIQGNHLHGIPPGETRTTPNTTITNLGECLVIGHDTESLDPILTNGGLTFHSPPKRLNDYTPDSILYSEQDILGDPESALTNHENTTLLTVGKSTAINTLVPELIESHDINTDADANTPTKNTEPDISSGTPIKNPASPKPSPSHSPLETDNPISPDTLKAGDSTDLLKRVETESIQLSCFSPPYNINKNYLASDDDIPIKEWYNLLTDVFEELFRVTKPDGKCVVNIGKSFGDSTTDGRFFFYPLTAYIKQIAIEAGFDLWDEAIWNKNGFHSRGGGALMGSYPSPSNLMITQTHEHCLVFRKWVNPDYHSSRKLPDPDSKCRQESKLTKDRWNTITQSLWNIEPVIQSNLDIDHSAVYPEEIPKRAIQLYSFKGDTILDPFIGRGTTAMAAKQAGRHYIGFDISEEYIKSAKKNINNVEFNDPQYIENRNDSNSDSQQELSNFN